MLRIIFFTFFLTLGFSTDAFSQSPRRGVNEGVPDHIINGQRVETISTIEGCEGKDIWRELLPQGGVLTWRSDPRALGPYAFVNGLSVECRLDDLERGPYCTYGGWTEVYRDGSPFGGFRDQNWSVDKIIRENGVPLLSGGSVTLSAGDNSTSTRRFLRGADAVQLRQMMLNMQGEASRPRTFRDVSTRKITDRWVNYGYVGVVNIRVRNTLDCEDAIDSCLLETEFLFFIPYNEVDRCLDESMSLS
jgi:hypothetical protein